MSFILRVGAVEPLGTTESHYGNGDDASASYTDANEVEIPLPEHTYQRPLPPVYPPSQNNVSCFGLPYQDHNYGMRPRPSPPRVPSPSPPSPLQVNGVVQMEEEVKTSPLVSVVEEIVEDSVTRCICGYLHDDGYMICCDKCSVWQHIDCMGVDRNCIPENYFCELCQPRTLDAMQAKILQKRKREELAARNVLSDSSATDTDPEEAANALASVGKKLPVTKKKTIKQRRNIKEKTSVKIKVNKPGLTTKLKKAAKKEKENIKTIKPKKVFKPGAQKRKGIKSQPLLTLDQTCSDPWNSSISPWIDSYEHAEESQVSPEVTTLLQNPGRLSQSLDIPSSLPGKLQAQLTCLAEVKKNRKGLKAMEGIPAGQAIMEYKGQVMLKQEFEQNAAAFNSQLSSLHPFVLFYSKLDVNLCVDAGKYGNEGRFIRRSCSPNAEVQCMIAESKIHFVFVAKKQIVSGSEVTIAFDYDYHNSSVLVECACIKTSCAVSRFWKKKMSLKLAGKEMPVKRRRQSSGERRKSASESQKSESPQGSPKKISSPVKSLHMSPAAISPPPLTSPVKLSNVSTLLAASALLDGQLGMSPDLGISMGESKQIPLQPAVVPVVRDPPLNSRRASRVMDDVKEEKPSPDDVPVVKEKPLKKAKEKETKESHAPPAQTQIKRERKLSSRRQSQEEPEEDDKKPTIPPAPESDKTEKEDSASSSESRKKMTREERKLDAILKAFEKLEKREERRKEAIARGDGPSTTKKVVPETKGKKPKDDEEESEPKPTEEDSTPVSKEVKSETDEPQEKDVSEVPPKTPAMTSPSNTSTSTQEFNPVKDESPQKTVKRAGKRKRRRSRAQSAVVTTDTLLLSQDESSTCSSTGPIPQTPLSVPSTPGSAPLPTSNGDGDPFEEIKYTKSKKHLFNEWSTKHETENSKQDQEMFVQCVPSSRGNAMDHLQRRNSHSGGCHRGFETSGGFAKKRWLRQAMHEVPAPANFNHSLSVATDNDSVSPIYGSVSPNPNSGLCSPGTPVSPLDFVTPLKKRRLMRESLNGEGNGSGVLSENAVSVGSRINGFKQSIGIHRHSVDDRMLIEKGTVQQNGILESTTPQNVASLAKTTAATSVSVHLNFDTAPTESENFHGTHDSSEHKLPVSASSTSLLNGIISPGGIHSASSSSSLSQSSLPIKFDSAFEKGITKTESSSCSSEARSSILNTEQKSLDLLNPSCSKYAAKEENSNHSSLSRHVLVNSVYSDVNNLIESSSEAGCVVTKSIMEADGPATVCVDLNAHEMEPSSLSTDKAIVDLNRDLFNLDSEGDNHFSEVHNDCQVNSSEDVSGASLGNHSSSNCDNPELGISPSQANDNLEEGSSQLSGDNVTCPEVMEVVDSSQQMVQGGFESEGKNEEPGPSSSNSVSLPCKSELNSISSSGQSLGSMDKEESDSLGRGAECDSMEAITEHSEQCDSRSVSDVVGTNNDNVMEQGSSIDNDDKGGKETQPCDSVDNGVSSAPAQSVNVESQELEPMEEEEDTTVSESCHLEEPSAGLSRSDSNVDSTSCEQTRTTGSSPWPGNMFSQCDSNYEREPNRSMIEVSASVDDSSAEEIGVSSSSALHSRSTAEASWEEERRTSVIAEALPDNAVSTGSPELSENVSPSTDVTSGTSTWTDSSPQQESSHEALPSSHCSSSQGSVSAVISSNNTFSPHPPHPAQLSTPSSLGCQESSESSATSSSVTTSSLADQVTVSLSSALSSAAAAMSTSEAVPATKKKVSLLEYRKRLKEKPAASPVDVKSSIATCQPTTVTLSSVSARFLSCGASSSSVASSSSTHYKKPSMPTLATLPLFKSADVNKEERHSKAKKKKVEKPLTLSERLRLEFGLDDCEDDAAKKSDWHRPMLTGESTPPPPPPPPLPLSFGSSTPSPSTGRTVHRENGNVDSSSGNTDESVPPPPPPGRTYPYPPLSNPPNGNSTRSSSSLLVSSSSTSRQGYHGPIVNGGPNSGQVYPQQSSISSTSVSPSHMRESNGPGYHLSAPHTAHTATSPYHHHHHMPPQTTPSVPSSSIHSAPTASWSSNLNTPPQLFAPSSGSAQPSSTSSIHPPSRSHDYSNIPSPHSHATVTGNSIPDEHPPPPPPPPLPPPRSYHHHSSSTSSSSLSSSSSSSSSSSYHKHNSHHHHPSSSSKKSNKAASSTSSSHYSDKKSRY